MKKIVQLLPILMVFQLTMAHAQCVPDAQYTDFEVGIYPIDTLGSTAYALPLGEENQPYETVLTAALPDIIMLEVNPGQYAPANLDSITIDDITGLPPGITYECVPPNCVFPDQALSCIRLSGTPTQAGTYSLMFHSRLNAWPVFSEITMPGDLITGEYRIVIDEAIAVDQPIENTIGLGQNIPNPFSDITQIPVDVKQSGVFEFKVYNIIGKLLHEENLTLSAGKNTLTFNGNDLYSGMYFYSIGQGNDRVTRRMIVHRP